MYKLYLKLLNGEKKYFHEFEIINNGIVYV